LPAITIPSSVEVIGHACFISCASLKNVSFESPSELRVIKSWAFSYCRQLQSFSLPSSVEFLGDLCFEESPCLTTFTHLSPSHLRKVRSFPPTLRGSIAVPDSVESFHWVSRRLAFPHRDGRVVVTFGLESNLQTITVTATLPGFLWRRCACVFEQLSSPVLKRLRASLEFPGENGYPPWYSELDLKGGRMTSLTFHRTTDGSFEI
jgi:hypothetical protein